MPLLRGEGTPQGRGGAGAGAMEGAVAPGAAGGPGPGGRVHRGAPSRRLGPSGLPEGVVARAGAGAGPGEAGAGRARVRASIPSKFHTVLNGGGRERDGFSCRTQRWAAPPPAAPPARPRAPLRACGHLPAPRPPPPAPGVVRAPAPAPARGRPPPARDGWPGACLEHGCTWQGRRGAAGGGRC